MAVPTETSTMFDRFTDRARKVMSLARQEAERFNHLVLQFLSDAH